MPFFKTENYYLPDTDRVLDAILELHQYVI